MKQHLRNRSIFLFILLILLTFWCAAETPEQVINPKTANNQWVSDMAGVIDETTEGHLNSIINQLEQKTAAEIAVVTIRHTDGRSPKEFATALFNLWGIGKTGKDNGVLVLLVMDSRRIEVETGYGIESVLTDGKVGEILRNHVVPRFKKGDFGGGLLAGVRVMTEIISGDKIISKPIVPEKIKIESSPQRLSEKQIRTFFTDNKYALLTILLIILIILLISYGIYYWRYVQHCPKCNKRMRRLKEEQDDAYLSANQIFEEEIGSINYRIWRCDDCQELMIRPFVRRWSGYEKCSKCKHRTLLIKSVTVQEPTYYIEGVRIITYQCKLPTCDYNRKEKRFIPIRASNFDSSWSGSSGSLGSGGGSSFGGGGGGGGGSFGGGSSGGGGAGASW